MKPSRHDAYDLVVSWTKNINLLRHMLAVESIMRALAARFNGAAELWGVTGLIHDADYEMFKDDPKKHPSRIFEKLAQMGADQEIIDAVRSHAWGWRADLPEPKTTMEWCLYSCDELSGLITACALVRPDRKLSSVTVESVLKKFPQKSFAAGAKRENIMYCEPKLGIKLNEFIGIALKAMQGINAELGL
ncbi:hypothetical protein A2154_05105 [Candidatus Gottesmanbacteria bacterium RBG_16_43_7]|uniref:HD domain-containing protein n=1 Tax=Candidatus Gottesmanbacteria bacterium RBG_16_43_7 TaxID=1798373 RepID=A0A1F5ZCL6_9BACT|nr:MAG: hypothetical protein A2154_05105 [Candidatus Gottesmanbacteria bacterium RBG_16_43_7]